MKSGQFVVWTWGKLDSLASRPFTLAGPVRPLECGGVGGRLSKQYNTFGWIYDAWLLDGRLLGFWHDGHSGYGGVFFFWPNDTAKSTTN